MPPRHLDKGGEVGHVAIHAVMAFNHQQRTAMARPRLASTLSAASRIEMAERHPPRARQDRALHDAVVDERVVHDDVVAAEQMADDGDVGRMPADEGDAILGAMDARQRRFELAMDRALAGDRAAGGNRGAVAVDRRLRRRGDARIAVQPDVIVGGEIDVGARSPITVLGAGDALVHAKERIADSEEIGGFLDHPDFPARLQLGDIEPAGVARSFAAGAAARLRRSSGSRAAEDSFASRRALAWADKPKDWDRPPLTYSAAADLTSIGS